MLTAIIQYKNSITGQQEIEGEAILLNCIEKHSERSFYEVRFINNAKLKKSTYCRWINNADIMQG